MSAKKTVKNESPIKQRKEYGLPEGTYSARAVNAGLGKSKEKNPQVAIRFKITEGQYKGREVTWYGSFSKNKGEGRFTPFERTIKALRACGWTGNDLSKLQGVDTNEVSIVIERETFEGRTASKVKWVNESGNLGMKDEMGDDEAKKFASKLLDEVAEIE